MTSAENVDWVARGIAIGGAAVALMSLGWNVFSWSRQGPVVKVKATCTGRGAAMKISGKLINAGRFDAEIEKATFHWPTSSSSGYPTVTCEVPAHLMTGVTVRQPLPAGGGEEFTIGSFDSIDPGLNLALHERRRVELKFHTATGKKAKAVVKYVKGR